MTPTTPEGSAAIFYFNLVNPPSQPVVVNYSTASGSATSGLDFSPRSGSVTLSASMSFMQVSVPTLTDSADDPNETFTMQITGVTGDAAIGMGSAQVTITQSTPPGGGGPPGGTGMVSVTTIKNAVEGITPGKVRFSRQMAGSPLTILSSREQVRPRTAARERISPPRMRRIPSRSIRRRRRSMWI